VNFFSIRRASTYNTSETAWEAWDWSLIRKRCVLEALRMLRSQHDAEEVAQEALAKAWRSRSSCRTPHAPTHWCVQITRNAALDALGRRRALEPLEAHDELEDRRALREHERTLTRIDCNRALAGLPADERRVICLRYEGDWSHSEIAATLGIPEATARVRLHRAHKRLIALLDDPS
jgi:RNA polymerase sigma-70 factor (ECF subfamily)